MDFTGLSQIRKELCMTEYICKEFPGLKFNFIPEGTLQIVGNGNPIIHHYSLSHNKDGNFILAVSPHILNEPSDMILKIMKNHITLESLKQDENNNPIEILHLSKWM